MAAEVADTSGKADTMAADCPDTSGNSDMWASEPADVASAVAPRFPSTGHGVLESPGRCVIERVTDVGTFRCQQHLLYLANAMVDQPIALEETDDGI